MEQLRSGRILSWPHVQLLRAAFDEGPRLTSLHPAIRAPFSQFNRGGLVTREKTKVQGSPLSRGIHSGHPCGRDEEPQFVCVACEAKAIGRFSRLHGVVHAAREIERRNGEVPNLLGFVLTKIGQARHAGREQARQANDSKTFQPHTSMLEVLWQTRDEKNK